ncbi:polysaccharide deacetylase family protein [Tahibacter amnicola]|uniref:Polysaccharide deacetylase family protein n=1 Tax=Tahibacter amnicola TaxID=2976241 RepID=A0ABY6BI59_9GAMM|nr:polysaccharide deacetylase family protein [Tahibacter amnicola]UXI69467.1 polysaccharide deacetylase family protein [Tahibacter amnicola]
MRVPILTYHAVNIAGNDYASNDHVAFAADLEMLHATGWRIVPLHWIVEQRLGKADRDLRRCVALTCDDGSDFDYHDLDHPQHGRQRSLYNLLLDFRARHGRAAQPDLHLTVFAIADPSARTAMDRACLIGHDWMQEHWWRAAQSSGLVAIENHSWDHNHPCLANPGPAGLVRGDFHDVTTDAKADHEIRQAQDYLAARLAPHRPSLFCYPFGHVNAFLADDWLPRNGEAIGLAAAFGDGAQPATTQSHRWNIPRYICGWHWKSPAELAAILDQAA